jgi:hypothetical protein
MKRVFFLSVSSERTGKLFILPALFILLSAVAFQAQNFEKGDFSELKGLTKLYINVGDDAERRKLIVDEIRKAGIPGLIIVDSRQEAEIVMRYGGRERQVLQDITTNEIIGTEWTMTTVDRRTVRAGQGLVFIAGEEKKRPRIIMTFGNVQDSAFEKRPAIQFAQKFVKAYKKANKLK